MITVSLITDKLFTEVRICLNTMEEFKAMREAMFTSNDQGVIKAAKELNALSPARERNMSPIVERVRGVQPADDVVYEVLLTADKPLTNTDVHQLTKLKLGTVGSALTHLHQEGRIHRAKTIGNGRKRFEYTVVKEIK